MAGDPLTWGSQTGLGYYLVGCGLRVYIASLAAVGSYSLLWVHGYASSASADVLAVIWILIVVLGLTVLSASILEYYASQGE